MGILSWKMKRFWDEVMGEHWMKVDGKIACAFSSSGGWGGGNELACQSILTVLMNFGFLVFGVTDYAAKLTTLHYGAVAAREPRGEDVQAACRKLGHPPPGSQRRRSAPYFSEKSTRSPTGPNRLRSGRGGGPTRGGW